jgi:hypothetical protein
MTAGTSMILTFVWEPLHRDTTPTANPRSAEPLTPRCGL